MLHPRVELALLDVQFENQLLQVQLLLLSGLNQVNGIETGFEQACERDAASKETDQFGHSSHGALVAEITNIRMHLLEGPHASKCMALVFRLSAAVMMFHVAARSATFGFPGLASPMDIQLVTDGTKPLFAGHSPW